MAEDDQSKETPRTEAKKAAREGTQKGSGAGGRGSGRSGESKRERRQGEESPFAQRSPRGGGGDDDDDSPFDSIKGAADSVRKAFMGGFRSVLGADDRVRAAISDSFAREMISYITRQVDAAKDEVVRMSGNQVRKFLENLDLGEELQKILTSLSFEIKTEIRFIPNDQSVRPNARVRVKVKGSGDDDEGDEAEGESKVRATIRDGVKAAVDSVLGRFGIESDKGERPDVVKGPSGDKDDDKES